MPIELLNFTALCNDQKEVEFTWITASELNNDYFTLESSVNGESFEILAIVDGAGNSNQLKTYSHKAWITTGDKYFRLKQTDFDGAFSYSYVISSPCTGDGNFTVYPNPAGSDEQVTVSSDVKTALLSVFSAEGKMVHRMNITDGKGYIDTKNFLNSGVYIIQIQSESGVVSHKLVIR